MYESHVAFMPLAFILLDGCMEWKMDARSKVLPYTTNYDFGRELKIFLDLHLCYNQLISVHFELKRKIVVYSVDMDIIFIFIAQRRRAPWESANYIDRNCIMLLTQLRLFANNCKDRMLTLS